MLNSNRNLGVLLSSLQLCRALLDKLPQLYIPLFEAEGVFHEATRLTTPIESPTIDKKPQHPRAAMAEQLLEGLVNSTHATSGSGVRVIIPSILLGHDNSNNSSAQQSHQQNVQQQQELVCKEAKQIVEEYTGERAKRFHVKEPQRAKKLFEKLNNLASKLRSVKDFGNELLPELKKLLMEQEITSFQFNQSGIPAALFTYLTTDPTHAHSQRGSLIKIKFINFSGKNRLMHFANVFMGLDERDIIVDSVVAKDRHLPFEMLISKLLQTIGTVEQFQGKKIG